VDDPLVAEHGAVGGAAQGGAHQAVERLPVSPGEPHLELAHEPLAKDLVAEAVAVLRIGVQV
jgi:hypothetical protein